MSDKDRKEFLEAARRYLFGMLPAKSVPVGL
ncbi:MAG: hypothetical protein H6R10_206 [Rhodocyclaceae bacterium]|nr:hypothetical protein [Rhodocyclaceae bacterium]